MKLRPDNIYLDSPIEIKGIKIGYTHLGAVFMLEHYEQMLAQSTPQQLQEKDRQHLIIVIRKLQECIQLYENQNQP